MVLLPVVRMLIPIQKLANNIFIAARPKAAKSTNIVLVTINLRDKQLLLVSYMHASNWEFEPYPWDSNLRNPVITKPDNTWTVLNKQTITNPRGLRYVIVSVELVRKCL